MFHEIFGTPNSMVPPDMGTTHFLFDSTQSQKVFILLNSWLTMALQDLIQISSRLKLISKIWFNSTHDSKSFQNIFIQINLRLKNFPEFWFESTHDSKNSKILIRIKSWLNDSNHLLISLTFFGLSVNFVDLFWGFTKFCWPFGISLNFVELFWHSSSAFLPISSWLKQYPEGFNRFNSWLNWLTRN